MQQRDNGSIPDDLSSLVPAKDEVRGFAASQQRPKSAETKQPVKPPRDSAPQGGTSGSTWTVLVALIVVVLALAGFAAYSWQMAQIANQQLTQASERLAALEARLSLLCWRWPASAAGWRSAPFASCRQRIRPANGLRLLKPAYPQPTPVSASPVVRWRRVLTTSRRSRTSLLAKSTSCGIRPGAKTRKPSAPIPKR